MKKNMPVLLTILLVVLLSLVSTAQVTGGNHDFYKKSNYPKLNYDSLFNVATPVDLSAEGKALLDNCLEEYGGKELLGSIESLRFQWRLKATLKKDSIDVTKTWSINGKHRTDLIHSDGKRISRFMINDSVWHESPDSVYVMDRNRTILEEFHYLNTSLPIYLTDFDSSEIRYGQRPGDSLEYLYIQIENELVVSIGIDPKTHLIVSSEGAVVDQELRLVYLYKYSEHTPTNGFPFPHRTIFVSMGFKTGESYLVDVEINPNIPDSYYRVK